MRSYISAATQSSLSSWLSASRVLTLLVALIVNLLIYIQPFMLNAESVMQPVGLFEPFIAFLNHRFAMLLNSSIIILLLCDLPICDSNTLHFFTRSSRSMWTSAQLFFTLLLSTLLIGIIAAICLGGASMNSFWQNEWSIPTLSQAFARRVAIIPELLHMSIPKEIIDRYLPYHAAILSAVLLALSTIMYGLAAFVMNLYRRSYTIITMLLFNIVSWSTGMFAPNAKIWQLLSWLSPHYHASLMQHVQYTGIDSVAPTVSQSMLVMFCFCILLALIAYRKISTLDLDSLKDKE